MRKDFGLNDDQIMNSIKILTSGKITPVKLGVDVVPFTQACKKRIEQTQQKQKIAKPTLKEYMNQQYQQLIIRAQEGAQTRDLGNSADT